MSNNYSRNKLTLQTQVAVVPFCDACVDLAFQPPWDNRMSISLQAD